MAQTYRALTQEENPKNYRTLWSQSVLISGIGASLPLRAHLSCFYDQRAVIMFG